MKNNPLRLLLVGDVDHAPLIVRERRKGEVILDYERVETLQELEDALDRAKWDAVLSDFSLPGFNGFDALHIVKKREFDTPFILVSEAVDEELAADLIGAGSKDCPKKGTYARLIPTLERELRDELLISENNFRTIFDSANDAIVIHAADTGKVLDVNQKMLEMYKYSKEEIRDMSVLDLSGDPNATEEDVLRLLHAAASDGPKVFDWLAKDRGGRVFWVEVSLKKVMLQGESRVLTVIRDISKKKEAQENLNQAMEQLTRSNRELEQFAYVASHDLQEPLRMVSNYMQLLEKKYCEKLDEKAKTYIHYALEGAKRMHDFIQSLLSYSRIGHAQVGWVDTNRIFADATANFAIAIRDSGAEVSSNELPTVWGDATQLLQLFQNLISNAIKYVKPGVAPRVTLRAEQDPGEWRFAVQDNGIGIDPEHFDRIFYIFQRLHTKEEYTGSGIGLASCKKIVEQQNGRIWVESKPGKGSTFFFTIPLKA